MMMEPTGTSVPLSVRGPSRGPRGPRSKCTAMLEKSQEFFQICDIEGKGFVTRRDMQRLHHELPLTADELENVFDTLDLDGNGYLTLEEFSSGFSEFLFGHRISVSEDPEEQRPLEAPYQSKREKDEEEEERHFSMLMESLGASNVFEDPAEVRSLWAQLRRDEPHLLSNFEEFLARVTSQIKEANHEKKEMESALRRKAATHDDELQQLYEEMEQQIKSEKDRILLQDSERFLSRSKALEQQLSFKERELEQIAQKQKRLERQCQELHSEQQETRVENVKLKQTNEELLRELEHTSQELVLAQEQLELLQDESCRLQEEREMEVYRLKEGLQRERESLMKQLNLLREMNKHLRDERDMCFMMPKKSARKLSRNQRSAPMPQRSLQRRQSLKSTEDDGIAPKPMRKTMPNGHRSVDSDTEDEGVQLPRVVSIEEDHLPQALQCVSYILPQQPSKEEEEEEEDAHADLEMSSIYPLAPADPVACKSHTPLSPRGQPVGKETISNEELASFSPERLFKIVIVGNSSVGKTSVLRRFCDDCFYPGTSATVGVDYSVKTVTVDHSQVALQMWDTAGQERYRSITKQFFRKADGVIVMYDITSQVTFMAVRHWLVSVQEGAGGDLPIMLLGNKTDKESERKVQTRIGEKLAKDCQLIFYECSAFSGHNVTEAMLELARVLKEQEDREKEKTVQLVDDISKKKSCC